MSIINECVDEWKNIKNTHKNIYICNICGWIVEQVHDLSKIKAKKTELKINWIKIKDELPQSLEKGSIPVLIACYSPLRKIYHIQYAEFQKNNFYDRYNERIPIEDPYWSITHWMYLPGAPNE